VNYLYLGLCILSRQILKSPMNILTQASFVRRFTYNKCNMEFLLELVVNLFASSQVDSKVRPSTVLFCAIGLILVIGILFLSL